MSIMNYIKSLEDVEFDPVWLLKIAEYYAIIHKHFLELCVVATRQNQKCLARTHDQSQCKRKCRDHNYLCGSHLLSLPYGRIDQPLSSVTHPDSDANIDLSKYVKTSLTSIEGNNYLIDENGILYDCGETNTIVGRKVGNDQINWFK